MFTFLIALITKKIDSSLSDEELVVKYLESQKQRYFDVIYHRYSSKVFAKALSILKNTNNAQDATQEIFIKVMLSLSKFSFKSKFSTWLYSITYNYCIDYVRKSKKDKSVYTDDFSFNEDPAISEIDDKVLLEVKIEELKIVLDKLNVSDSSILLMKYQDELSIKDICTVVNKSESAVKMKIKRAKQKFRILHESLFEDRA